jgi:hypothetical protein
MATGESEAALHGATEAVATTGHDAAHAVARVTEEAATTQERIIADVESADRDAAARLAPAASGRAEFPVAAGVPGPARNAVLRSPHARHTIPGARHGQVKADNTVTLRGYEGVLRADTERIAAGQAEFVAATQVYVIDGRSYRVKPNGTVFPISGPGLVHLSRGEYEALHLIARANGDVGAVRQFEYNALFRDTPQLIAKAKAIYDGTYTP